MTYPLEFRRKVFATKEKFQLTFQETSERFDIPIRTIFRWQRQLEPHTQRKKPATKVNMEKLAQHVKHHPDASGAVANFQIKGQPVFIFQFCLNFEQGRLNLVDYQCPNGLF